LYTQTSSKWIKEQALLKGKPDKHRNGRRQVREWKKHIQAKQRGNCNFFCDKIETNNYYKTNDCIIYTNDQQRSTENFEKGCQYIKLTGRIYCPKVPVWYVTIHNPCCIENNESFIINFNGVLIERNRINNRQKNIMDVTVYLFKTSAAFINGLSPLLHYRTDYFTF